MIQLYNLEGQPMEQIPDGSPIPSGRWPTPNGGQLWSQGRGPSSEQVNAQNTSSSNSTQTQNTGSGFSGLVQPTPTQSTPSPTSTTTTTPPPQTNTTSTNTGFNAQAYGNSRPDLLNNWSHAHDPAYIAAHPNDPNISAIASYPSLEAYLLADSQGYPGGFGVSNPTTGGFSGLTPNNPTLSTPNLPSTSQIPTIPNTPSPTTATTPTPTTTTPNPTTSTTPNTPTAGSTAYNQLLQLYKQNGGHDPVTPQDQQAFNQWAGQVTAQFGVSSWDQLPADFAVRFNPNGSTPQPVGYQPYTPVTSAGSGGNYNQNQQAAQTGAFNTTGTTSTNQQQQTGQITQQQQTGTQQTQQTGTQQTSGTQQQTFGQQGQTAEQGTTAQQGTTTQTGTTTGTSTTAPTDLLGFGSLLQQQGQGVLQSDADRSAFLRDVIQTGGSGFNSQVDKAVRQSLTGPQMTGAGDSARARAAGYAAADVARNNMGERLAAAQQLAGPTGFSTLAGAAVPFGVGSTTSQTGTTANTGTTTQTGSSMNVGTNSSSGFNNLTNNSTVQNVLNTLSNSSQNTNTGTAGFSNLTGTQNESSSGTATGQSSQAAAGQIPNAQTVSTGGGGCVLCTAAIRLGYEKNLRILRRVIAHKLHTDWKNFRSAARGYFFLFTPLAAWLLGRPRLAKLLYPLAKAVVYEELRISGRRLPRSEWACFVHNTGHTLCSIIGKFPVPGKVTNPTIEKIARENNIWFPVYK